MKKVEATSVFTMGVLEPRFCGVCCEPIKVRQLVDGVVTEPGETVWFETWSTKPFMHLACCDEKGKPLLSRIVLVQPIANCDGSGRFADDPNAENRRGAPLEQPCPGCRACR